MKKMGAKNLLDFKLKLKALPFEWWLFAFEFPATKRKMTHFFGVAQSYYSLDDSTNALSTKELTSLLDTRFLNDVTTGPLEVAKQIGEIIDEDFSLWVSPSILSKVKKEFKLVPGSKEGRRKWLLAAPPFPLIKEGLVTHEPKVWATVKTNKIAEDKLMDIVVEAGAEDMTTEGDVYEILTTVQSFEPVRKALALQNIPTEMAELRFLPDTPTDADLPTAKKVLALVEELDAHDDINSVHHSLNLTDALIAALKEDAAKE
jgi:hypothetical protein